MAAIGDLSLIGFLKTKMRWHEARQQVLANNVANADTPNFRPQDLSAPDYGLKGGARGPHVTGVSMVRTNAAHIGMGAIDGSGDRFDTVRNEGWEIKPSGNSVVLEQQMMDVAGNQFDFQLASTLYSRSLGLIKTALGRSA